MYRYRVYSTVRYGHFAEFVELTEELDKVMRAHKLTPFTLWTQSIGTNNKVVLETEYPDLATLQTENDKFYSDSECMKLWRRGAEVVVQDSAYTELWEPAPHLA